jgi:methylthioribose-1-phosphate isomerase
MVVIALCVTAHAMAIAFCVAAACVSSDFGVAVDCEEVAVDERRRTCVYFDEVGFASPLARRRRRSRCDAGHGARSDSDE